MPARMAHSAPAVPRKGKQGSGQRRPGHAQGGGRSGRGPGDGPAKAKAAVRCCAALRRAPPRGHAARRRHGCRQRTPGHSSQASGRTPHRGRRQEVATQRTCAPQRKRGQTDPRWHRHRADVRRGPQRRRPKSWEKRHRRSALGRSDRTTHHQGRVPRHPIRRSHRCPRCGRCTYGSAWWRCRRTQRLTNTRDNATTAAAREPLVARTPAQRAQESPGRGAACLARRGHPSPSAA